jgi:hypothetical protein
MASAMPCGSNWRLSTEPEVVHRQPVLGQAGDLLLEVRPLGAAVRAITLLRFFVVDVPGFRKPNERRRSASVSLARREVRDQAYYTGFQERSTSTSISVGPSNASAASISSPRSDKVVALCAVSPSPRATETKSTRGLSRSIAT